MADETVEKKEGSASNKKLLIMIGAGVAALILIVALVLAFSGGRKEGDGPAKEEKKEAQGEAGKEGVVVTSVYSLEPFIVNIYDGQEIRYLKVKVEFEVASPEAKGELDARLAPMRDAILVLLTTKTMQDIADLQGKNQLRDEILIAVSKIVPPGKVTKVYFTEFVVQ